VHFAQHRRQIRRVPQANVELQRPLLLQDLRQRLPALAAGGFECERHQLQISPLYLLRKVKYRYLESGTGIER
jgi:hypothetical protein